ncbi:MAG: hypothetical protein AAGA11_16600 [Pseudomonadota bacterium]
MKKWLNNPVVVGLLATAALGVVLMRVAPFLGIGGEEVSTHVEVNEPGDPNTDSGTSAPGETVRRAALNRDGEEPYAGSADLRAASALSPSQRDPFRLSEQAVDVRTQALTVDSAASQPLGYDTVVTAIVEGPNSRYAVLNARIVTEGDRVGVYEVVDISSAQVLLKGPEGQRTVSLSAHQDRRSE